jgi:hypothetical protein
MGSQAARASKSTRVVRMRFQALCLTLLSVYLL